MKFPEDIQELFYKTLSGEVTPLEFEEWLYADKRLETLMPSSDYLELISYGYKGEHVKYGLYQLLEKHIEKGDYEKWKLMKLLQKALEHDESLPQILMSLYELYGKGYGFLNDLALRYGLRVEVPYELADSWDQLSQHQQETLLNSFYPNLPADIERVIGWLENEQVVLTGIQDEYDHYVYIDNRSTEERKSRYESVVSDVTSTKPWWKFW